MDLSSRQEVKSVGRGPDQRGTLPVAAMAAA